MLHRKALLATSMLVSAFALGAISSPAFAQSGTDPASPGLNPAAPVLTQSEQQQAQDAAANAPTKPGQSASQATGEAAARSNGGTVGEVVVVGSRIRRDTFNAASPITVVTREETTLAGFNSTASALQGTAITTGAGQINNSFGNFVTDGGPGANTLSLRGLGATRTLVLLNGRRVAPAGTRGSVGSADLNVLPDAIIDRVEVLKAGASSIYGSDAIAGVVNIITRRNISGLEFELQGNPTFQGGGDEYRASVVGGYKTDRWQAAASFDYTTRTNLTLADREFTQCNTDYLFDPTTGARLDFIDPRTGQPKCYPITGTGSNGVTINTLGTSNITAATAAARGLVGPVARGAGSVGTTFNRFRPNGDVTTGLVGFEGVGGGSNPLNVRDTFEPRVLNRSLISPADIYTAFLNGSYKLNALGDAEVYGEFLFNRRDSSQVGYRQLSLDYRTGIIQPGATSATENTLLSPQLANLALRFPFAGPQAGGITGTQNVGVRAFIGFGNDESSQRVDYLRGVAGIRGNLPFKDWRYDLSFQYARSEASYRQQSFLIDKLTNATDTVLAPAGFSGPTRLDARGNNVTCRVNLTNAAEGCVPEPVLSAATIGGQLPGDFVNYVFRNTIGTTQYDEKTVSANIDGTLLQLPAGPLKGAFGFEYRTSEIDDTPDINSQIGNLYGLTSATPTRGSDNVKELYGELEAPILRDVFLARDVRLNASGRYTDYASYGSDWTYKVGVNWALVDGFTLRGTYSTSFRAPALFEQFLGSTSGFLSQQGDPCNQFNVLNTSTNRYKNCLSELPGLGAGVEIPFQQTSSITVLTAGGAAQGLLPETSANYTIGGVITPKLPQVLGDVSLAVDYFKITVDNGVERVGAGTLLSLCYDDPAFRTGGGQGFCRYSNRLADRTLVVNDNYTNVSSSLSEGIDFSFRYTRKLGPGSFRLNLEVTKYLSQAGRNLPTSDLVDLNGTIGAPDLSAVFNATYTWGPMKFRYGFDYLRGQDSNKYLEVDPTVDPFIFVTDDYYTHRISVQYSAKSFSVTAGVQNLTDETPPSISYGAYNRIGNAPLYSGYDYLGRRLFINLTKSF